MFKFNQVVFTSIAYNQRGQVTGYTLGNGLSTTRGYDDFGFPTTIQTPGIQNLTYQFDTQTGNLNRREDVAKTLQEDFTYDNLMKNRLESWQVNTGTTYSVNYASNGNINTKTGLGTFSYNAPQPHAVSEIENTGNLVSEVEQIVKYTPFNKVDTIREGSYRLEITYGPDEARKITRLYNNNVLEKTKYYIGGNYEVEIDGSGYERKLHYIYGGDGLVAIFEKTSAAANLYYIHKDHLGSFTAVTNESAMKVDSMSFDPWDRRRNSADWTFDNIVSGYLFDRGYTGHEHLDGFSLINMNGRVYDPILGRFLSPDNYIQLPDYTQSLNRYSYCLNNPLIYTDPSGEFLFHLFAAWASNYLMGVADNWINKEMPLGEAFKATPVVAGVNFSPGNQTFSHSQVNAHNIANQDISIQISGFSGMNSELSGYGDFVINQQFMGESPLANNIASLSVVTFPGEDRGLYDASTQILNALSYAYNYGRNTLPKNEATRWNSKLTMVDLIKFGRLDNNPAWAKSSWKGIYTGRWDGGIKAVLKADNAFNIDFFKSYDYGNYKNNIVLWLEPSGFPDPHTGMILSFPNGASMQKAWDYITRPNSWTIY